MELMRRRWSATAKTGRAALILAASFMLASAVIFNAAEHTSPSHRVRTVTGRSLPAATTTDASGCPATLRCELRSGATPALRSAISQTFPHATVQSSEMTYDPETGRTYRAWILARTDADTVSLASQCIPRAATVAPQTLNSAQSHVDLSGNSIIDVRITTTIVPGTAGCSVAVELRSAAGNRTSEAAARRLAHNPAVQLSP